MDTIFASELTLWVSRFVLCVLCLIVWAAALSRLVRILRYDSEAYGALEKAEKVSASRWLLLACVLTAVSFWGLTIHQIDQATTSPDRTLEEQRQRSAEERVESVPTVSPDTRETLEQRAKRVAEENAVQNAKAKEAFKALKKQ